MDAISNPVSPVKKRKRASLLTITFINI